ncbi:hypothetical protein BJ741DRAFT_594640 [Chytriomyces cf. hyalinus JEL632]|nr:hypothetical protein BJ741DRAFT_594640 [Chytriomyces cf. hyalinus JEL632]
MNHLILLLLAGLVSAAPTAKLYARRVDSNKFTPYLVCDAESTTCSIDVTASTRSECDEIREALLDTETGMCEADEEDCFRGVQNEVLHCIKAFDAGASGYAFFHFYVFSAESDGEDPPPLMPVNQEPDFEPICSQESCSVSTNISSVSGCTLALNSLAGASDAGFCEGMSKTVVKGFSLHGLCVMAYKESVDECYEWMYHGLKPYTFNLTFVKDIRHYFPADAPATTVLPAQEASSPSTYSSSSTSTSTSTSTSASTSTSPNPAPNEITPTDACTPNAYTCKSNTIYSCDPNSNEWTRIAECPSGQTCLAVQNGFVGCTIQKELDQATKSLSKESSVTPEVTRLFRFPQKTGYTPLRKIPRLRIKHAETAGNGENNVDISVLDSESPSQKASPSLEESPTMQPPVQDTPTTTAYTSVIERAEQPQETEAQQKSFFAWF